MDEPLGVDRGQGQEFLTFLDPSVGAGVTFDAVAVLLADGTGFVLDLLAGTPPTFLDPGAVSIDGDRISVTLSEALLPSTGFLFGDYGYNRGGHYAWAVVDHASDYTIGDGTLLVPVSISKVSAE